MSQTNCECSVPSITVPVTGLKLELAESAFDNIGGAPGGAGISYSFDEQWTGKYWVDKKKIYQKTIDFGAIPANSIKQFPHNIPNIETPVNIHGIALSSSGFIALPHGGGNTYAVALYGSATTVIVSTMRAWPGYTGYIVFEYTCTDR